jgi:hypothetical protein
MSVRDAIDVEDLIRLEVRVRRKRGVEYPGDILKAKRRLMDSVPWR